MTTQEQNLLLAKWDGWTDILQDPILTERFAGVDPNTNTYKPLPSYTTDLNAVHELGMKLAKDQHIKYVNCLFLAVGINRYYYMTDDKAFPADQQFRVIHATASQRCEALLKTLGLWKD